jgi:hypothetical protein
MANTAYDKGKANQLNYVIGLTLKAMLLTTSYIPGVGDNFVSAITTNELAVTGYTRQALGTLAVVQDDANTRAYFTAANTVWSSLGSGATIGWVVVFIDTGGGDSTNWLLGAYQTTATPTNGGSFTVQWASGASVPGGVYQLS